MTRAFAHEVVATSDRAAPIGALGEPAWKHSVMIVSTVDDPSAVHAHLATLFPGNLCVTQVGHSLAELTHVVARLAGPDGWDLDADSLDALLANRVLVELPVLDEAAVARIGADTAMVEAWPMVRPS